MTVHKPQIQYIGEFYVHGSEARKVAVAPQKKTPKTRLPIAKLEKIEKVYVDPIALAAVAVAVLLLVTMVMGVMQIQSDWQEYQVMRSRVHDLKELNHEKTLQVRETYDLEDIRLKATAMGMVPKAEAESMIIHVTMPEKAPQRTWVDDVRWFVGGLFAA